MATEEKKYIDDKKSAVVSSVNRNKIAVVVIMLLGIVFSYYMFFKSDPKKIVVEKPEPKPIELPSVVNIKQSDKKAFNPEEVKTHKEENQGNNNNEEKSYLKDDNANNTPVVDATSVDTKKKPPYSLNNIPSSITHTASAPNEGYHSNNKRTEQKIKSSIMFLNSNAGTSDFHTHESKAYPNISYLGDRKHILDQGKIIEAVLETAVVSNLRGQILAYVSRDVYASRGKYVLIPKGSKLLGNISKVDIQNYGRIMMQWHSIYLPNGYVVNLNGAEGVDSLGVNGMQGRVDSKNFEKVSNAVLTSAFSIAVAKGLDKVISPPKYHNISDNNNTTSPIISMINNIIANAAINDSQKCQQICISAINSLNNSNALPSAVMQMNAVCGQSGISDSQKLTNIVQTAQSLDMASGHNSNLDAFNASQSSKAVKDAYGNVTGVIKDIITQDNFVPTITIPQGASVRIMVHQPIVFPDAAIETLQMVK